MYAPERQQQILDTARTDGRVEVVVLAERFGVTPETIRRDLSALERRGQLRRVHGGALPMDVLEPEPTVDLRRVRFSEEKQRIAERAVQEIRPGATVLLDSGTSTAAIAGLLPADAELTVITNSVSTAAMLAERPGIELLLLGGRVRPRTGAAVGAWLEHALTDVCVDVAFLGTNGYHVDRGFTTPDQVEAAAKRAMLAAARQVVVAADSSKAGQVSLHRFAAPADVALLITDTGLDEETAESLDAIGLDLIRV